MLGLKLYLPSSPPICSAIFTKSEPPTNPTRTRVFNFCRNSSVACEIFYQKIYFKKYSIIKFYWDIQIPQYFSITIQNCPQVLIKLQHIVSYSYRHYEELLNKLQHSWALWQECKLRESNELKRSNKFLQKINSLWPKYMYVSTNIFQSTFIGWVGRNVIVSTLSYCFLNE